MTRNIVRRRARSYLTMIIVLGALTVTIQSPQLALVLAGPQQSTTITLEHSDFTVDGCETIDVEIWINDVIDLYGADVRLSFDPATLEGTDIVPGDFLQNTWTTLDDIDNDAGTVAYAVTQLNPQPPADGSGILATLQLRAVGEGNSDLEFTFTQLANRNGVEIPATSEDGSVTATAPASPSSLSISRLDNTTAQLSWTGVSDVEEYHLYRETVPYFTPSGAPYHTTTGLSYDDANALGNTSTNHYYVVRSACENGFQSADSNRVGEFDFELHETADTDYTWVALPLSDVGPTIASELANHIVANSNASVSVQTITRWNATGQSPTTYNHEFSYGDFSITSQHTYRVEVNITDGASAVWTQVGNVPAIDSYDYTLNETADTDYSWVMQPLDRTDVVWASELANDIESNASASVNVETVTQWNPVAQSPTSYNHDFGYGDFPTREGYPYRIEVDIVGEDIGSVTWP